MVVTYISAKKRTAHNCSEMTKRKYLPICYKFIAHQQPLPQGVLLF